MEIPDGVEKDRKRNYVCKLRKSPYGTKQAPRCWKKKMDELLKEELHFEQREGDPCIHVIIDCNIIFLIALYVDDVLIAATCIEQILWMKQKLNEKF